MPRRRSLFFIRALLPGLLLACGGAEDLPDAGGAPPPDGGGPPPCTLEASPARLDLRVGGGGALALSGEGWADVVFEAPAHVEAIRDEAGLAVRAGYMVGEAELRVVADCGTRTASVAVPVDVAPLEIVPATTWTPVDGPVAREYFSMWVDPLDADRLWLASGFHYRPRQFTPGRDVWSLDLTSGAWTGHDDTPQDVLPGASVAVHPDGYVLRYGGLNLDQVPDPSQVPFRLHTVETSTAGLRFTDVDPAGAPSHGDYQPSFFFHPPTGLFYAACGVNEDEGAHCDLSIFDPRERAWASWPTQGEAPEGRNGHFWAYDPVTDRLVVFAGEGWPGSAGCDRCQQDTWALEMSESPPRWVRLLEDGGPLGQIGRRNGAFTLDPVNHRLLVWGGTPDGRNSFPGLFALDLRRGEEAWHEVPLIGEAPARASGGAVFDAARSRVLLGFGNGNEGIHADLWSIEVGPR